ncbi:MAG: adenylate/guanylate cyclase domain-containing response regulator [Mesorhizobium sp.]|uniref:response regulator n=1 Tax=Mesorhizobium sp. TaxID=1871066 RepID=UPI000FE2D0CC|nr:response regulator [Mesorhizobium sp.]RWN51261.1 MAG: adenylate/guanylate cyclase domain-containing response regulator [Mesorhizobium sp.]RWN72379.1 MAG: adenylate/guanylate cyclase domain-containing response regulator [Mesorhizobium sp.]RWN72807.1 MAG: adenylate/guanylate cyclase domain-containing response regulator [Mesorhizobium sp.]RWN84359.1 MAG: adenylate/guanylate cyclase domain-containing response regulator [Mesorhizobium sp.]RWO08803.1 MAG: adenylate/guanylate cyclase domain-contai
MHDPPRILAVDDTPENLEILRMRLEANGYEVATAADGEEGLAKARELTPDLILLDIMMPKLDGISVVRMLKHDQSLRSIPVILVTAKADTRDVVEGLDAGGDDYLTKPFEHRALLARVRSMLRQKALHDTVASQAKRLEDQAAQLSDWNRSLEQTVAEQVTELERMARLRRFLPEQVADLIVAAGNGDALLQSHRREVTVVFCDLRGFTAFAETAEPEEVMTVLAEYHSCLGEQIVRHEGTLERFVGDGIVVVFNDPLPCADHSERAVSMAAAMRDAIDGHSERWRKRDYLLGFGIGIARGHATIGRIGFDRRSDYAVIGTVSNHAARLCEAAKSRQILVSQRVLGAVEALVESVLVGDLTLKGFRRPMPAYEIVRWFGRPD